MKNHKKRRITLPDLYFHKSARQQVRSLNEFEVNTQTNIWSCGPLALRYALLCLDIDIDASTLIEACNSGPEGTNEKDLQRGANCFDAFLEEFQHYDDRSARKWLESVLPYSPVILPVDRWEHWVVAIHSRNGRVLVMDSSRPGPIVRSYLWRNLKKRWRRSTKDEHYVGYVVQKGRKKTHLLFKK